MLIFGYIVRVIKISQNLFVFKILEANIFDHIILDQDIHLSAIEGDLMIVNLVFITFLTLRHNFSQLLVGWLVVIM